MGSVMRSTPTEPRSIRSQLVLLFTSAGALLLFCGLGVLYAMVIRHAASEDDAVLADKIAAIDADLKRVGDPGTLAEELKSVRAGENAAYWIRILDRSGHTQAETPGMNDLLPPNIFPAPPRSPSGVTRPKPYRSHGRLFFTTTDLFESLRQPFIIQVAQDRSDDEHFQRQFGALSIVVLALGIIASAAIAITVTRRGLRPLAQMTQSLDRTGPAHLNERVAPSGWPRELQPLAVAFDEMLDRLEDSFTRLSQFSADLAHELRTPIANILGEAQVALRRPRTLDEYRQVIESNAAECERLSAIVDSLLFLARAEAADEQIHRTQFNGRPALEKIASFYQPIAEEKHVTIDCRGDAEIYADPVLFDRAVGNLVDNAVRFSSDHGTILISIVSHNGQSEISVQDTGPGISAEHISRVFDRFYRADSARSSGGTGLGLALVKSIVDLHGGSASMRSEPNQGTTVTLTFPHRPSV